MEKANGERHAKRRSENCLCKGDPDGAHTAKNLGAGKRAALVKYLEKKEKKISTTIVSVYALVTAVSGHSASSSRAIRVEHTNVFMRRIYLGVAAVAARESCSTSLPCTNLSVRIADDTVYSHGHSAQSDKNGYESEQISPT